MRKGDTIRRVQNAGLSPSATTADVSLLAQHDYPQRLADLAMVGADPNRELGPRLAAINGLAYLGASGADSLRELANDPHATIRKEATLAYGRVGIEPISSRSAKGEIQFANLLIAARLGLPGKLSSEAPYSGSRVAAESAIVEAASLGDTNAAIEGRGDEALGVETRPESAAILRWSTARWLLAINRTEPIVRRSDRAPHLHLLGLLAEETLLDEQDFASLAALIVELGGEICRVAGYSLDGEHVLAGTLEPKSLGWVLHLEPVPTPGALPLQLHARLTKAGQFLVSDAQLLDAPTDKRTLTALNRAPQPPERSTTA